MNELNIPDGTKVIKPQQKEEERPVKKVTTGNVKVKKRNPLRDDVSEVASYAWTDVLVPKGKDLIAELISNSIDMLLFGEVRGRRGSNGSGSRVSYDRYYDRGNRDRERRTDYARPRRDGFSIDDIIFEVRADAEDVIEEMLNRLDRYKVVTVADFYEYSGQDTTYTMRDWGWTDLRGIRSEYVRDGYVIKLPRPYPLEK